MEEGEAILFSVLFSTKTTVVKFHLMAYLTIYTTYIRSSPYYSYLISVSV